MALISGVLFFAGHRVPAAVVGTLTGAVVITGLFAPKLFAAWEGAGRRLGHLVGVGLTWVLLVPFYYLCFGTLHLVQLLLGKDPLQRQFPTSQPTYWTPRPSVNNPNRYQKQY